jgi:hypothetical protein
MSVTTLSLAKSFLQIAHSAQHDVIQMLLDAVESEIETVCTVRLASQTVTELLTSDRNESQTFPRFWNAGGNGSTILIPTKRPVTALTSVIDVDGGNVTIPCRVQNNLIYRADATPIAQPMIFPAGINRYQVTYTAGFATFPAALTSLILRLVHLDYTARSGEMASSEGGVSRTFTDRMKLLQAVQNVFNQSQVFF